jgi:hypothetical protein
MFSSKLSSRWADAAPLAFGETRRCDQAKNAPDLPRKHRFAKPALSRPSKNQVFGAAGARILPQNGLRTGHAINMPCREAECSRTLADCGDVLIDF